jgi:hypothetical protein
MKYRKLLTLSVVIAAIALGVAAVEAAQSITPPSVPSNLEVLGGSTVYRVGHAVGTQNYICLPKADKFAWTLFGPQATLFNDKDDQQITHFLSANPGENGMPRPTWQHSGDSSSAWAAAIETSSDSSYVAPGAIPWLLLQVVGAQYGPALGHKLTYTTYIQRVNTAGGVPPVDGCAAATDVGKKALVPYAADYYFYRQ